MSEECHEYNCFYNDSGVCENRFDCQRIKAHNPDSTTAGQVGSSGLLVARSEGDQPLGTTCLTAGPIGCPPDLNHKPGGACPKFGADMDQCKEPNCIKCEYL